MTDLLSSEEAARAVGIGANDTTKTGLLAMCVTAITDSIENDCGPVVYGTVTAAAYDGGGTCIYLNRYPVQGVIQVVEYDQTTAGTLTAETNSSKPNSAYVVNLDNGKITRRTANTNTTFPTGTGNVVVTYVAGRCLTTATVPNRFKLAASVFLRNVWRTWEPAIGTTGEFQTPTLPFPAFSTPKFVRDILANDWQTGSGGFDV